jgi:hypothetical protein
MNQGAHLPSGRQQPGDRLPPLVLSGPEEGDIAIAGRGVVEPAHRALMDRRRDPVAIEWLEQASDLKTGIDREVHHLGGKRARAGDVHPARHG